MNIGVIGIGDIGAVIVKKSRDAGYPVKMANSKGPDSLRELAAKTGAIPVSVEKVVQDVDILFLVFPQKAFPVLPKGPLAAISRNLPAAVRQSPDRYPAS
jgi:hypothetical protein